jgi:D-alanine-D-alanine ligase
MRVAIIYNEPGPSAAELDVLVQRDAVHAALAALGHECQPIACTLNLSLVIEQLRGFSPHVVFNLVESLDATDRLAVLVPMLLDANHIAYTGTRARAMLDTSDKVLVKQRLKALGLPTPAWYAEGTDSVLGPGTFIIKARYEHASVGLDDSAVVTVNSGDELAEIIRRRAAQFNVEMFAEQFIAGREFNLSVMATKEGGCQTLAPAEIDFSGFPDGKPQIVNFDAKWTETAFEYSATPRSFYFPKEDDTLLLELARLTRVVWQEFDLRGYARVDYRVDETGQPFILEINTNPCLSPDAGFVAAVQQSGSDFAAAIATIVEAGATFKA